MYLCVECAWVSCDGSALRFSDGIAAIDTLRLQGVFVWTRSAAFRCYILEPMYNTRIISNGVYDVFGSVWLKYSASCSPEVCFVCTYTLFANVCTSTYVCMCLWYLRIVYLRFGLPTRNKSIQHHTTKLETTHIHSLAYNNDVVSWMHVPSALNEHPGRNISSAGFQLADEVAYSRALLACINKWRAQVARVEQILDAY